FDLDHFKTINDNHGHAAGDYILKSFAETALAGLRPGDLMGRLGGEEFAVILPGADAGTAYQVAERVRCSHATAAAGGIASTVSGGVADAIANSSLEATLEAADRALYRAKAEGRNRVAHMPEPASRTVDAA